MKKLYPMGVIFLIFMIGIGFILYPSIGNLVTLNTASVTIADYEKVIEENEPKLDARLEEARRFNEHLYYGTNAEGEDRCLNMNGGVICYLDIPKIHVYLPVYYGTSDEVLRKGCGYIEHSSLPVGGENTNTALSGHTGLPGAELLSSLDQLELTDVFYLHVLGEILAYEVEEIATVEPDDPSLLEIVPGRDLATLVTCTPYGINSHRLIVRGKRIPYVEEQEVQSGETVPTTVKTGLSDTMRRQLAVIFAIVALALSAVLIAAVYYWRAKAIQRKAAQREQAEKTEQNSE